MEAFAVAVAAGLAAGLSAAAPWFIYARQIVPRLASARARRVAYVVAALPALATSIATLARLNGLSTGSFEMDVTLLAIAIGLACSWSPIVRLALVLTGGPRDAVGDDVEVRALMARTAAYVMAAIVMLQTVTAFAGPAYRAMVTCRDAEAILADLEPGPPNPAPLPDALPHTPPESGALYIMDLPLNLDQAASSRHDPATRAQLVEAGFVAGHIRLWYASDGRGIQADVMEFGTPEGAAAYQAGVTRHACQFASEAFEAPMGGVGLQVNYDTGDPIVEQISWVAGNRRYLVSVSELDTPSDHGRILAIRDAAMATWPVGGPAPIPGSSPQPSTDATPRPVTDTAVVARAMDDVRAALEATLGEGTVWITKHAVFTGSSVIPDGAMAYGGGQMSLQEPRKMRAMVQFAEIEDTNANSAEIILDGSLALVRSRIVDSLVDEGTWLLIDLSSGDPRVAPFKALASGHNDPSMPLFTLYGATRVMSVSDHELNGLPMRIYELNIQVDAGLDALPDDFVSGYQACLAALQAADVEPQYTAEVWVGEDGMIHHIEYTQKLGPNMGGGTMSTSVDFADFGLPLELDYPEPQFITPLEDVEEPQIHLPRG